MKIIDIENHYYAKEYIEYLATRKDNPRYDEVSKIVYYYDKAYLPLGLGVPIFDNITMLDLLSDTDDYRIKAMNEACVNMASLSCSPSIENLEKDVAVKYAKLTNDKIASICKKNPDRYIGTICLPTPYIEESIAELERAVRELGLKYFHTHSNYGHERLSDDKFIPILKKCEVMNIPIYIHPHNADDEYLTDSGMMFSSAGFGFSVDTMKTALNLVLKGRFDEFPKLKIVLGHLGEFFPYIMDRIDNRFFAVHDPDVKCKHNFMYYFKNKNFLITTSGITDQKSVIFAIDKLGIDSIMFGSDYPYESLKEILETITTLPISEEDKEKILYKNAEKYLLK